MALILLDDQQVALHIAPVSRAGNPARIDGMPQWSVSDPSVISLQVDPSGLACVAVATGKLGTCQVQVTADADLGPGIRQIGGVLDIDVQAGEAVSLAVTADSPVPKPL